MRVLVTWASTRSGTAGAGQLIADVLKDEGYEVTALPSGRVGTLDLFDGVILGGALRANRWPASSRRFLRRHLQELRRKPVWLFSSGALSSAESADGLPPEEVSVFAERIGAQGHLTLEGPPDGSAREAERIRLWATEIGRQLPSAKPRPAIEPRGRSLASWLAHPLVGWASGAVSLALVLNIEDLPAALATHAIVEPLAFAALAWRYFGVHGARAPLPTAVLWTLCALVGDVGLIAGSWQHSLQMLANLAETWLPLLLIFATTWAVGVIRTVRPLARRTPSHAVGHPGPS